VLKILLTWQETLLGGALQFLAEIGEDISTSIPDRQLHDGDYIEIQRQVRFRGSGPLALAVGDNLGRRS
jgi:hypothetical protein